MKLRNLNGAIRKSNGPVNVWFKVPGGAIIVATQKVSLLEQIGTLHGNEPNAETGLYIRNSDNLLMCEGPDNFPPNPQLDEVWDKQVETLNTYDPADTSAAMDDDDLLGGPTFTSEEIDEDDLLS